MARDRSPSLRRKPATRDPKWRFIIFCEGENTEPAYFTALKRLFSDAKIDITPIPAGMAYTCAGRAVEVARTRRYGRDSFEDNDQVWAVFDRDQTDRYDEAVALCERAKVGVGRSNPCFEVFLILHHQDFDRDCDSRAAERQFQAIHPAYDPDRDKKPGCRLLLDHLEQAEVRAELQLTRRAEEGNPFGAPSTTVHHLTRAIRAAAERSRSTR